MGILDTIIDAKRGKLSKDFEPLAVVEKVLALLKHRDRKIPAKRHGLSGEARGTLEAIGRDLKLTRERVRQIEKQLIQDLKRRVQEIEEFQRHTDLLHATITDHGGIMAEADLLETLGIRAVVESAAVRFLLVLVEGIEEVRKHKRAKDGWKTLGFDESVFRDFLEATHAILQAAGRPHTSEQLLELLKTTDAYKQHASTLTAQVVGNFLTIAHSLAKNPLGEYGLRHWAEVSPRDVGDKAYLALKSNAKPTHYKEITRIINALGFTGRKAHDETVHNELIKDSRFVLVGRGIYALQEWGYSHGVVTDVIADILRKHGGESMHRDRVVDEVMKRRVVKRNTVLVSLANRKRFVKIGKDGYALAK